MRQKRIANIIRAYQLRYGFSVHEVATLQESCSHAINKTVHVPDIKTKTDLMVFLHEVGHIQDETLINICKATFYSGGLYSVSELFDYRNGDGQEVADNFMVEQTTLLGIRWGKSKKEYEKVAGRKLKKQDL